MKILLLPIVRKAYQATIGKTVIECNNNGKILAVFANGDIEANQSLLCNVTVHEVGDTFVAQSDSKTMTLDDKGVVTKTPVYLKGQTVTRQKESVEFKSLTGNDQATQFNQAAFAYGNKLYVVNG